jgi:glycosyltransferase involved in cell wall biosynthesis
MKYTRPELPPRSLTVFFPCHNEQGNVERVTRQAVEIGRRITDDLEVLIVDDGSRDRTAEIAAALAEEISEVRVVSHEVNRGYGAALRSGYRAATKDWIFYTDGDGQFDLGDLPGVIEGLGDHDIFSGVRSNRQDSLLRKINAHLWNLLIWAVIGLRLRDIDCAFKLLPANFIHSIEIESDGAMVDAEVLFLAAHTGLDIQQLSVRHLPRSAGESCGAQPAVILRALGEVFTIRRRLRRRNPGPAKE